jgi:hypothetical protein
MGFYQRSGTFDCRPPYAASGMVPRHHQGVRNELAKSSLHPKQSQDHFRRGFDRPDKAQGGEAEQQDRDCH